MSKTFGCITLLIVLAQPGFTKAQSNDGSYFETAPREERRVEQSTAQRLIYQRAIERSRRRSMRMQRRKRLGKSMLRPTYRNHPWATVQRATYFRPYSGFGGNVWPTTVYWR